MFIESFKKRKLEASSFSKLTQLQIDNNKLNTDNTKDIEGKFEIQIWNKCTDEIDSDSKKESKLNKKD